MKNEEEGNDDDEMDAEEEDGSEDGENENNNSMDEGEEGEMDYDPRAYDCLHSVALEWPCLSFDVVVDELGDERCGFPHTMVMVAGTQASAAEDNAIVVSRLSNLGQGRHGDKYDSEDEAFGDESSCVDYQDMELHPRLNQHYTGEAPPRAFVTPCTRAVCPFWFQ